MNIALESLPNWLQSLFRPRIAYGVTPMAQEYLGTVGVDIHSLLVGVSDIEGLSLGVNVGLGTDHTVTGVSLDFVSSQSLEEESIDAPTFRKGLFESLRQSEYKQLVPILSTDNEWPFHGIDVLPWLSDIISSLAFKLNVSPHENRLTPVGYVGITFLDGDPRSVTEAPLSFKGGGDTLIVVLYNPASIDDEGLSYAQDFVGRALDSRVVFLPLSLTGLTPQTADTLRIAIRSYCTRRLIHGIALRAVSCSDAIANKRTSWGRRWRLFRNRSVGIEEATEDEMLVVPLQLDKDSTEGLLQIQISCLLQLRAFSQALALVRDYISRLKSLKAWFHVGSASALAALLEVIIAFKQQRAPDMDDIRDLVHSSIAHYTPYLPLHDCAGIYFFRDLLLLLVVSAGLLVAGVSGARELMYSLAYSEILTRSELGSGVCGALTVEFVAFIEARIGFKRRYSTLLWDAGRDYYKAQFPMHSLRCYLGLSLAARLFPCSHRLSNLTDVFEILSAVDFRLETEADPTFDAVPRDQPDFRTAPWGDLKGHVARAIGTLLARLKLDAPQAILQTKLSALITRSLDPRLQLQLLESLGDSGQCSQPERGPLLHFSDPVVVVGSAVSEGRAEFSKLGETLFPVVDLSDDELIGRRRGGSVSVPKRALEVTGEDKHWFLLREATEDYIEQLSRPKSFTQSTPASQSQLFDLREGPSRTPKGVPKHLFINVAAVQERFWVEIAVFNPLRVPVTAVLSLDITQLDFPTPWAPDDLSGPALVTCHPCEMFLAANSRSTMRFTLSADRACYLNITGATYIVNSVTFQHSFFCDRRRADPSVARMDNIGASDEVSMPLRLAPRDKELVVTVTKELPLLRVIALEDPRVICHGELSRQSLRLQNVSNVGMHNVCVMLSEYSILPDGGRDCVVGEIASPVLSDMDSKRQTHVYRLSSFIPANGQIDWNFTLFPSSIGRQRHRLLFFYQDANPCFPVNHRVLPVQIDVFIVPSLHLSCSISPDADSLLGRRLTVTAAVQEFNAGLYDALLLSNSSPDELQEVENVLSDSGLEIEVHSFGLVSRDYLLGEKSNSFETCFSVSPAGLHTALLHLSHHDSAALRYSQYPSSPSMLDHVAFAAFQDWLRIGLDSRTKPSGLRKLTAESLLTPAVLAAAKRKQSRLLQHFKDEKLEWPSSGTATLLVFFRVTHNSSSSVHDCLLPVLDIPLLCSSPSITPPVAWHIGSTVRMIRGESEHLPAQPFAALSIEVAATPLHGMLSLGNPLILQATVSICNITNSELSGCQLRLPLSSEHQLSSTGFFFSGVTVKDLPSLAPFVPYETNLTVIFTRPGRFVLHPDMIVLTHIEFGEVHPSSKCLFDVA